VVERLFCPEAAWRRSCVCLCIWARFADNKFQLQARERVARIVDVAMAVARVRLPPR